MNKRRCMVCGYVHQSDEPPEQCPVCGADRGRFAPVDHDEAAAPGASATDPASSPSATSEWECTVCGFTHSGAAPPDTCPVCGSEGRHFNAVHETPRSISTSPAPGPDDRETPHIAQEPRWQCSVCGYIHTGPEPPEKCPVCGADKSQFVRMDAPEEETAPPETETGPTPIPLPPAAAFLAPYRRWIDLAIDYHAHPIAVHVPNGVLPITVAMVFLAAIFDWPAIGRAAFYNMGFIFLSMPVVLFTGYLHWQFKFGGHITNLFKWKITCGTAVLVLSIILFAWGLISPEAPRDPGAFYLLLHVVMLIVAGIAGWLGGKLVFRPKA